MWNDYLEKILKKEYLDKYYENYVKFRCKTKESFFKKKMYEIDLHYLNLYKNKGKLIDIGCSNGSFLNL